MATSFDDMLQYSEQEVWDDVVKQHQKQVEETKWAQPEDPATYKQRKYMRALVEGKDLTPLDSVQRDWLEVQYNLGESDCFMIPKRRASDVIGKLKQLEWKPRETQPPAATLANLPEVADGRYAVHDSMNTTGQPLSFFKVKNGRYKTFLDVYASDNRHPIYDLQHIRVVLEEIAKDPVEAMKRFGVEMKRCGRCGRALTDETSRAFGIGPDCRGKMGI